MKQIIKHCEECKKVFMTNKVNQKFCSNKCRNKHTNRRNYVAKPVSPYKYISVWGGEYRE